MTPIFITGTGTAIGKTVASVIIANALGADYWKPVQAGLEYETDSEFVKRLSPPGMIVHAEVYRLKLAASPHIAARMEGIDIDLASILTHFGQLKCGKTHVIVEGAGGLMVPLNDREFVIDLIRKLNAKVILVSRNYLGSINHSLLTAAVCRQNNLDVLGWIFNDKYLEYGHEIARWTQYPVIGNIPKLENINPETLSQQSDSIRQELLKIA